MRKSIWASFIALMAVLAAALVALLPAASASADSLPYSGTSCASISVSSTVVNPGQSITVTGSGFPAKYTIDLYLYPKGDKAKQKVVQTVKTDADGDFATTVVIPSNASGHLFLYTLVQAGCPGDLVQLAVQGAAAASTGGGGGGGQGTASTGFDVAMYGLAAIVLVGAGVLLTSAGRRRRASSHH